MAISKITSAGVDPNSIATNGANGAIDVNASAPADSLAINASGNVGIGTSSPSFFAGGGLQVSNATQANLRLSDTTNAAYNFDLFMNNTDAYAVNRTSGPIVFGTNNTESARITSGGQLLVGQTSHGTAKFAVTANVGPDPAYIFSNASTSSVSYDMFFYKSAAAPNSTGARFLTCADTSADRLTIQSNGSVINATGSYGTISDQKLKQDIVDAGSQWDDIKNLRFRKYRFKTDVEANPDAPAMLGLVAQEVELVSPGLVDESPDVQIETGDLGTTTKHIKTSVLYMKAVKALQEAMGRIETLEAENDVLKSRLDAVEALEARIAALEAA